jgi:hypothetical protein
MLAARRHRLENACSGNLRCDQERGNDGRQAEESQELIHRKHDFHPPKIQFARCVDCWSPVRTTSEMAAPDIVSSARIEITANVLMGVIVVFDCGRKRQSLALFRDDGEKQSWHWSYRRSVANP